MAETDVKGLLERASIEAGMLRMGEPVAFGSDAEMIEELAEALVDLSNDNDRFIEGQVLMQKEIKALRAALSGTREAGEPVAVLKQDLIAWRDEWLAENNPQDGTDCVTPFDTYLYAAPPAEVERGVVTDETVRLACPQCDFGIGLHEPRCGQLPAALTFPTPAPQPAVEAQGVVTLARFTPTPSGRMMWDKYGEWVDRSDCMRALASEKARADRLAEIANQTRDVSLGWKVRAEAAEAELAKLRENIEAICGKFERDGEQGYRSKNAEYVLDIMKPHRALRPTTSEEEEAG